MYLFLLYGDESQDSEPGSPEEMEAYLAPWMAYDAMLRERGVFVAGEALMPSPTARTVSTQSGAAVWTDGPFAETREQLGGFYLVRCDSQEEAEALAAQCPGAQQGRVEVRPVMSFGE